MLIHKMTSNKECKKIMEPSNLGEHFGILDHLKINYSVAILKVIRTLNLCYVTNIGEPQEIHKASNIKYITDSSILNSLIHQA
jgi:hypothetical protein